MAPCEPLGALFIYPLTMEQMSRRGHSRPKTLRCLVTILAIPHSIFCSLSVSSLLFLLFGFIDVHTFKTHR